jgi:cellulose synthase/poly-beta-1,6-N-acetylglucosamine synthase-like glycosyltransferase
MRGPRPVALEGEREKAAIAAESLTPAALLQLSRALGPARRKIALASRASLAEALENAQRGRLMREATLGLSRRRPGESAIEGAQDWQLCVIAAFCGALGGAAAIAPREALTLACAIFSLMFALCVAIRALAAAQAIWPGGRAGRRRAQRRPLSDRELPRYTVLAPVFREARVLPRLIDALSRLDYPAAKLDVKIVLESVDSETIAAARAISMPGNFQLVVVPDRQPRTKPKALNYALQFATGDLLVIFDAEDRPEPDQLRKAANAFAAAAPEVVCLQARLDFYNADENWLSRQFTIEYASLFRGLLPMLDSARLPLPLGGTSNHFRVRALRRLGGWDAYNVTEDADLGMRIARAGLRCEMLDSTTYEEAACHYGNWLRQRSRWLKGWMQTYGVHMRRPLLLFRQLGARGFFFFQGQFAGVILSALAHPLFYALLAFDWTQGQLFNEPQSLIGAQFLAIALFNLAAGYGASLALGLATARGRPGLRLARELLLIPFYWLMISAAAYRALFQLVTSPFHWDKTEHGVSRQVSAS